MAHIVEEALTLAERIGYPVIVRPSFVIGGLAIDFCYSPEDLARQLAAGDRRRPGPARSGSTATSRASRSTSTPSRDGERVLIPGLLEHVERAGVHSRRLGRRLPAADRQRGRPGADRRHDGADRARARRAGPRQRPVHRPRRRRLPASRSTRAPRGPCRSCRRSPACRWSSWRSGSRSARRSPELGWDGGLLAAAAVRRGQGAGVLDGQAARRRPVGRARACSRPARSSASTRDPRVALAKALLGAALRAAARRATAGALALLSIADRDKAPLPRLAAALAAAGYRLAATPGTRAALRAAGLRGRGPWPSSARRRTRRSARSPILELIAAGEVRLVVNTPTPRSGAVRDAAEIRHAAIAEGILCLTAMETAVAAAEALDPAIAGGLASVRALGEWVPEPGQPRRRVVVPA